MDLYQSVCVWVVTGAGSLVIVAFAVYFVVVVAQLTRQVCQPPPQGRVGVSVRPPGPAVPRCSCGGELGSVEKMDLTDTGTFEVRTWSRCAQSHRLPVN